MIDNRQLWQQDLAAVEQLIAERERKIAGQRQVIADLERDGHDTASARALLRYFEELQEMDVSERDRLRNQLGE